MYCTRTEESQSYHPTSCTSIRFSYFTQHSYLIFYSKLGQFLVYFKILVHPLSHKATRFLRQSIITKNGLTKLLISFSLYPFYKLCFLSSTDRVSTISASTTTFAENNSVSTTKYSR